MRLGLTSLWLVVSLASGYRILAFLPTPGISQHNVFAPILHNLASRGHQVVYLTPVRPALSHPNLEIRLIPQFKKEFQDALDLEVLGRAAPPMVTHMLHRASEATANYSYGAPAAQALIHSSTERFDALIVESYFYRYPVSALLHKFSCPAIEISTLGDFAFINELSGLPDNPAYQMDFQSPYTDDMSFHQRLYNTFITWSTVLVSYYHLRRGQADMDQYFNYTGWEGRPSIGQLVANRSLILINQDPIILGYPVPLAPHVKLIGGVNIVQNPPLDTYIKNELESARNGFIYFSMGSNLNTSEILRSQFGQAFIKVFSELPLKVVVKWDRTERPQNLPRNIFSSLEWIPQQGVLGHRNCKLFISHGGYLSLTEAVFYGVPVLGVPFFGDQYKNLAHAERAGYALKLDYENVTYESVKWAIWELLSSTRYREEVMRRSKMYKDRRWSALEEATHWILHVIKYPNALTPRAVYLSFPQLHNLDIFIFLLIVIVILIWSTRKTMKYLKGKLSFPSKQGKEKMN